MEDIQSSSSWKSNETGLASKISDARLDDNISEFGDWACGEQLVPQHLVVDFTPSEEMDTTFVQKKCCAFWDLVHRSPELRDLMVLPEVIQFNEVDHSSMSEERSYETSQSEVLPCETPALDVIKYAEKKGIIAHAFEGQMPMATCPNGNDLLEDDLDEATASTTVFPQRRKRLECTCDEVTCKSCKNRQAKVIVPSLTTPDVKNLCQKMDNWDQAHPKSMEPPGPPPVRKQCAMQRLYQGVNR